jgi:CDP-diacylglycerol--glycerol-3-phosphate 3-phosphatidyltransferase
MQVTVPNIISFLRAPLAVLFIYENTYVRLLVIFLAMITDGIDGYLARKYKSVSVTGAVLDPLMDKFFVSTVLIVLFKEQQISVFEALAMLSRDFSLCVFAIYLAMKNKWGSFQFQSIRWGKITTAMQFLVLSALTLGKQFSASLYVLFVVFGCLAFFELLGLHEAKKT